MRWIIIAAALLGASSVILGAVFQHSGHEDSETLLTALRYHQLHSIVILALGLYGLRGPYNKPLMISALLFIVGTLVFSTSLYALVLLNIPALGAITPIGGLLLISGWLSLTFIKPSRP